MAEIRSFPVVRHLRAEPTSHIVFFKRGRKKKSGAGLAFWFAPLGASLAEVPLEDRDLAFVVTARSADFQEVSANGVVAVRTSDPELLASRIDFSIDAATGRFRGDPIDKLAKFSVEECSNKFPVAVATPAVALGKIDHHFGPIVGRRLPGVPDDVDDRQAGCLALGQLAQPSFIKAKLRALVLHFRKCAVTGRCFDIQNRDLHQFDHGGTAMRRGT